MSSEPNVSSTVVSYIRTYVPIGVGAVATWLAKQFGVEIDTTTTAMTVTAVASGAWYLLARTLEKRWPKLGWLLGYPSQPRYPTA